MVPLPLSQGVVLSLLQQLACDINNDPSRKLAWMTDVAAAINPSDPAITLHVRPIFEQVYQILNHQRSMPTMTGADLSSIRLLLHVINSMLMTCKWFFSFPEPSELQIIGISVQSSVSFFWKGPVGSQFSMKHGSEQEMYPTFVQLPNFLLFFFFGLLIHMLFLTLLYEPIISKCVN